jgi:hypothetical protein
MKKVEILRDTSTNEVNEVLKRLEVRGENVTDIQLCSNGDSYTKLNVMIVYE